MTNAPPSRKTHIVRIVGTNRDGERLTDIWLDLERMDIIKGAMQVPPDVQWQGWQRKLRWGDDPDNDGYFPEGLPSRRTAVVKVCDPSQDVNDPDEWIPVRVIKGMRSLGGGSELQGQGFVDRFRVDPDDQTNSRVVDVRKIVHYDTNIDDQAQAAFDADPTRLEFVVAGQYEKDPDTKDEDQFVEHEIVKYYKPRTNNLKIMGLGRQVKLLNQYLIDESDPPDGETIGASGFNPPYRLDPFQNIVNVNFAPRVYVILILQSNFTVPVGFALPLRDDVEVIESRNADTGGGGGVCATLLECSAAIGEDFAKLTTGSLDQLMWWLVCPKRDSVRSNWFETYVLSQILNPQELTAPFRWFGGPTFLLGASTVNWKIRYAPHLLNPAGQTNRMVQLYPTSGAVTLVGLSLSGWSPNAYRLDRKGDGQLYNAPPEWLFQEVWRQELAGGGHAALHGLKFGVDPPLIAADIPS